jgi:hypothetical protein
MAYQQFTLADLKLHLLGRWDGTPFWTPEEARLALNEALRVWNSLTGMWRGRVVFTAAGPWVTLPSAITFATRVEWNSLPLASCSIDGLDQGHMTWESETISSGGTVPTRPMIWAPAGLTTLAIWPADPTGLNCLVVDGVLATPTLVLDTDYIDIGEEDLGLILGYALHTVAFKLGGRIFADTLPYFRAFIAAATDRSSKLNASAAFRTAMGRDEALGRVPRRTSSKDMTAWQPPTSSS